MKTEAKQTVVLLKLSGGKLPPTFLYSDCVADELIKGGQGLKFVGGYCICIDGHR